MKYFILLFTTITTSSLLVILMILTKKRVYATLLFSMIMFVQWFLSVYIPIGSKFEILKTINLFTIFSNLSFGFVYQSSLTFIVLIGLMVMFIVITYVLFTKFTGKGIQFKNVIKLKSVSMYLQIGYQVLISSGGILALLFIFLYSMYGISNFKVSYKPGQKNYLEFKTNYIGEIDDNLLESLADMKEEMDSVIIIRNLALREMEKNPSLTNEIYSQYKYEFEFSKNENNLAILLEEIETAKYFGIRSLVDDRGPKLLVMYQQPVFFSINMLVLLGSLFLVGLFQGRLKKNHNNYFFILTSKSGLCVFEKKEKVVLLLLSFISTSLLMFLHLFKIRRLFPINFSNSLSDLLISNMDISLYILWIVIHIILTILGYLVLKISGEISFRNN